MRKIEAKYRVGLRAVMHCGEVCEVIEYKNQKNMAVKFIETGEVVKCEYGNFKKRQIKSHFTPSVLGVGIIGLDKTRDNGIQNHSYNTWSNMLKRCYSKEYQIKYPAYKGCKVCDEWIYYGNFARWFDENYYEIKNERMELDKDILSKGNKIYSPERCIFVPKNINLLFIKNNAIRGDLPIGVTLESKSDKYRARCNMLDFDRNKTKEVFLGHYSSSKEAFNAYKNFKEKIIKQVADYHKDKIPKKLYKAMYEYKIEIDD